jgi:hypothetical protein
MIINDAIIFRETFYREIVNFFNDKIGVAMLD